MTVLQERCKGGLKRCSKRAVGLLIVSIVVLLVLISKCSKIMLQTRTVSQYVRGDPLSREDKRIDEFEVEYAQFQVQLQNDLQTLRNAVYPTGQLLNVGQKTDPIVLCIPCFNFGDVRDVAILVKSILLNTKSRIHIWFFASGDVIRTLNVLFNTWDIAQMAAFRVEKVTKSKVSMESLKQECLALIKEKFLFLLPQLIFAEDIANLWATNDTLISTLKSSRAIYNQTERDFAQFPPDLLNTVYSANGDAFRGKNEQTEFMSKNPKGSPDPCSSFKRGARLARRRHICFYCYPGEISNRINDVTLFTQLTFDRLYALAKVLDNWEGPASIALHLSDWEAQQLVEMIETGVLPSSRANVQYHVVFKRGIHYPINVLRNIAMKEVRTKYFFVLDVDLVPKSGLYSTILSRLPLPSKRALVVPALETKYREYVIPSSKKRLIKDFHETKVRQYHLTDHSVGHAPVNYTRWLKATSDYLINYHLRFEPYIVLAHEGAPQFAEVLVDRLRDKIEYMYHLNKLGYQYTVLHDGFIVHLPHPTQKEGSEIDMVNVCRDVLLNELHEEWVITPAVQKYLAKWELQHST